MSSRRHYFLFLPLAVLLCSLPLPKPAAAAVGDRLQTVDLAGAAQCRFGTSLAAVPGSLAGFSASPVLLVVSCSYEGFERLAYLDPVTGTVVKEVSTSPAPPAGWGTLAYRAGDRDLAGCTNAGSSGTSNQVFSIDPGTGAATFLFQLPGGAAFTCNSLTWDATDRTFFTKSFVLGAVLIAHWRETGELLGTFPVPYSMSIFPCGGNGLAVGGDDLYIACDYPYEIVRMDKRNGSMRDQIPGNGDYLTDLECDPLTFSRLGLNAVWARRPLYNQLVAFEIPPGSCGLGGLPTAPEIRVNVDVKPGSCPSPVSCESRGVLPVAILGAPGFDPARIDPSTVRLAGVAPLRSALEDVAGVSVLPQGGSGCEVGCGSAGPDGLPDLTLKFDTQQVLRALGGGQTGSCVVLQLTGRLRQEAGGNPIVGQDTVRILCNGKRK